MTFDLGRTRTVCGVSEYTIGEVAERSGFSASALRYYEGIGLLAPSTRSHGGYRLYDDATLDRLAFIARAKQLGCTLVEISDLLGILEGERCGPVQRRLHDLVTTKISAARRQAADVTALASRQAAAAASLLDREPVDGPCSDGCACVAPLSENEAAAEVPIACTLDAEEVPGRRHEWQRLVERARSRSSTGDGGVRLAFGDAVDLEELARLVAAEQACCVFFSFAITVGDHGIGLEVRAPEGAEPILADLFGPAG